MLNVASSYCYSFYSYNNQLFSCRRNLIQFNLLKLNCLDGRKNLISSAYLICKNIQFHSYNKTTILVVNKGNLLVFAAKICHSSSELRFILTQAIRSFGQFCLNMLVLSKWYSMHLSSQFM